VARDDLKSESLGTGADATVRTLIDHGVEVCFTNPGTSEMHFLAALDRQPELRCVLGLAETVVTGAADGYARIAGKPAVTLLHTGPGLANGLANLHNARRAPSPVLNIVGDHATHHRGFDTPLSSDVAAFAAPVSHWVRSVGAGEDVVCLTADALAEARSGAGRIATLIVPADLSWSEASASVATPPVEVLAPPCGDVAAAAAALRREGAMLLLGGNIDADLLARAGAVAAAAGARLAVETFPTRLASGAGRARIERLPYLPEMLHAAMAGVKQLVIAGAHRPVTFFAYPDLAGDAVPAGCFVHVVAGPDELIGPAIEALAAELGSAAPTLNPALTPSAPAGPLNPFSLAQAVAATLPEQAILVDESISGGMALFPILATAAPHDWLFQTGGAIGWGLPAAVGAAVAAPRRKLLCVEGDGSALYSIPALWTMARERLDVTVVIIANRDYAILKHEYARVRASGMGPTVAAMTSIGRPDIDFVALATGFGVEAVRVESAEALTAALDAAFAAPGPHLIEAVMLSLDLGALLR
jgi:acetolactate synthase-1/2/3 large subunit